MSARAKLVSLILLMAAPFAASYLAYYFWKPTGSVAYGELLPIRPLSLQGMRSAGDAGVETLKGKWVLLSVDSGDCAAACTHKLYLMRQVRTAQGKHMDRVARAIVLDDTASIRAELLKEYEGTVVLMGEPPLLSQLPTDGGVRSHIFLLDPLGNLVLRYPENPDPKRMIKDLTRLLSVSQIG